MLKVIENRREIAACQRQFEAAVRRAATEHRRHLFGFPGGTEESVIWYAKDCDLWVAVTQGPSRYGNACGIGDPFLSESPAPHLEINPPLQGIDRRIAGAFVKDIVDGTRYLAHSGRVGGGAKGVSAENFRRYYPACERVDWGGVERPAYVISALDDPELMANVGHITRMSKNFREQMKAGLTMTSPPADVSFPSNVPAFRPEFEGTKTFTTRDQVVATVRHGRVVTALRDALTAVHLEAANTINRDLYVCDDAGNMRALFEVKTTAGTTSVYEAIGQLFFHAVDGAMRVAVLPNDISATTARRLEDLGLQVLRYSWTASGAARFHEFDRLVRRLAGQ
jgi:hypothetical protein